MQKQGIATQTRSKKTVPLAAVARKAKKAATPIAHRKSPEGCSARWKRLWQATGDIADTATALGMLVDTPFYFDEEMLAALTDQLVARLYEQHTLSDSLSCETINPEQEARENLARKKHFGYTKEVEAWYGTHSQPERSVRNDARHLLVSPERRARILIALRLGDSSLGVRVAVPW